MTTRYATRVAAVSALALSTLAVASPAVAAPSVHALENGTGDGLSFLENVLIFAGIPLGLFCLITLLVLAPSIMRGGYKPSLGWWAEPVWFGGPSNPYEALEDVHETQEGGGASARW